MVLNKANISLTWQSFTWDFDVQMDTKEQLCDPCLHISLSLILIHWYTQGAKKERDSIPCRCVPTLCSLMVNCPHILEREKFNNSPW